MPLDENAVVNSGKSKAASMGPMSTDKLTSEQRFERICALGDLMRSGPVHLQLKAEFLGLSILLPQEAYHMDSILRSVRPDASLERFCGLLIDAALLRADTHSLTRFVRHAACPETGMVKAVEWIAERLMTFKAMEKWLEQATISRDNKRYYFGSDDLLKESERESAAVRLSRLSKVFDVLCSKYKKADTCKWLGRQLQHSPRMMNFQSSDASFLVDLLLRCDQLTYTWWLEVLLDDFAEGDHFSVALCMATIDAHELGRLSRDEMEWALNEFMSYFDHKRYLPDHEYYSRDRYRYDLPPLPEKGESSLAEYLEYKSTAVRQGHRPWTLSPRRCLYATSKELARIIAIFFKLNDTAGSQYQQRDQLDFLLDRVQYKMGRMVKHTEYRACTLVPLTDFLHDLFAATANCQKMLKNTITWHTSYRIIIECKLCTEEPTWMEGDLTRPTCGCTRCVDCNTLDDFLLGDMETMTFHISPARADHIEERVRLHKTEDPDEGLKLARNDIEWSPRCLLTVSKTDSRWENERRDRDTVLANLRAAFRLLKIKDAKKLLSPNYYELLYGERDDDSDTEVIYEALDEYEEYGKTDVSLIERIMFRQVSNLQRPAEPAHVNAAITERMLADKTGGIVSSGGIAQHQSPAP